MIKTGPKNGPRACSRGERVAQARPIPIKNIYYLFLYAWNHFQQGKTIDVSGVTSPGLVNLFAKVLHDAINHVRRRGFYRDYREQADDLATVRGKILAGPTIGQVLERRARVFCEFDELSYDILPNQVLKSTLMGLSRVEGLDADYAAKLRAQIDTFAGVTTIRLSTAAFRRLHLHGNNAFYGLALKVCALIHDALLPEERSGRFRFRDILEDEVRMSRVFEQFLFNFYRLEQTTFGVKRDRIEWDVDPFMGHGHALVPAMNTDVSLRTGDRTIILDAKYSQTALRSQFGSEKLQSGHLYQVFSYVKNLEVRGGVDARAEAILLYPTVDTEFDVRVKVQDHWLRACTIDLNQDWETIHGRLMGLLA